VVCGYLHSRDPLFDPGLRVFPPVFVVRLPDGPAADWVRANIAYALEQTEVAPSSPGIVMSRLPELLLVEVLRLHLASAPAADRGWLAALNDPVLRPGMSLLHSTPERRWTVSALAREAAVSRSVLDARFREVLGRSPIRYLTQWRMHLAEDLLATNTSASASSPAGLATTLRKPSAAHSSAHTASRQGLGVPLICCADATTKLAPRSGTPTS
jgi:AraC-like DNA-binding protein